ncbi:cysteine hydrolase [Oscillibacter sp. MSJ-2]|uniref:Cysteine hydrolase n=1 Tax=Dysosmobacter acutus TaxID=2841504 RepID=A0ABS6FBR3_9FIRM|nr:isochorismatase family cysteine hydrolase [Dysosmobacter acutus]MBU5627523.1 cysteine hydrolase [Dysosmobacter acutus]
MRVNDRHLSFYYEMDDDIGAVRIDRPRTALLVIDMQYSQISRPLGRSEREQLRWEPFYRKIEEVVLPNNQTILETFRRLEMNVCFAKVVTHKRDGSDRSLNQKGTGFNASYTVEGDPRGEIVAELAPAADEIVVCKGTESALTGTNLRLLLHNMGIDTVVVTGVLTDQCVSSTVRSLADESFRVWLIEDACMAATEEIHNHELEILNNLYCHVINTAELLEALSIS